MNTNPTGAMSAPNTSAGADIIGLTDAQHGQLFECSDHGTSTPARRPSLDDVGAFFRAAYLAGRISALRGKVETADPVPVRELLEVLTPGEAGELGEALRGILARRRTSAAALPSDRFDVAPACPAWCAAGDHGGVAAGERTHWSVSADLPVTLEDPGEVLNGGDTVALMVDLALNEGDECGPVVELGDTTGRHGWTLTLEEADQVADRLRSLTAKARRGSTVRRPGCAPWCSEHRDSGPTPEDQLCVHTITSTAFGEILLSYSLDDGPMVNLYRTEEELTFPNAEALARVILAVLAGHKGGEAL
ncbi:hypothetical protein [Streptosporangium sp. NPDC006007]|uniref:DUF6907 domain-containing protein n=1 Tax=Streptosporangium sp. NPDC006007 TaxID=3154575 RepID=UPI0033BEB422